MILTVDELREHVSTALEDDAAQRLLDAAEAVIVRHAGEPGAAVDMFNGHGRFVHLSRPAESITSITETYPWSSVVTTLAADDYLAWPGGYRIERLSGGTNSRWQWYGRVAVTYVAKDDDAIRIGVQLDLVNLAMNYNPGATSEQIGAWMEQAPQLAGSAKDEFASILARLSDGPSMVVVG